MLKKQPFSYDPGNGPRVRIMIAKEFYFFIFFCLL